MEKPVRKNPQCTICLAQFSTSIHHVLDSVISKEHTTILIYGFVLDEFHFPEDSMPGWGNNKAAMAASHSSILKILDGQKDGRVSIEDVFTRIEMYRLLPSPIQPLKVLGISSTS